MIFADLFYHGFRYVYDCLSKYAKLKKVWWPLVTLILICKKYDPNSFERTLYELSNIFSFFATMYEAPRTIPSLLEPARNRVKTLGDT